MGQLDLATYAKPPVVEVVAAARFDDLPPQLSFGLTEFWRSTLSHELPEFLAQPPYQAPVEQFNRRSRIPEFTLDLSNIPPSSRLWFASTSGDELVQLQPNWLACNWRKVAPDSEYGRWHTRRQAFQETYRKFSAWIEQRGVQLNPNQCEVTYINHIYPIKDVWESHADPSRLFKGIASLESVDGILPEQSEWRTQYLFNADGAPQGRLHVKIQPAFNVKDDLPIFVMELTARGAPAVSTLDGVMNFLDAGRRAVVTMFGEATTSEAQADWGRQQ